MMGMKSHGFFADFSMVNLSYKRSFCKKTLERAVSLHMNLKGYFLAVTFFVGILSKVNSYF
jgi:hypothetical protein